MRMHIQRVRSAQVVVADEVIAQIDRGLLVLIGFCHDDTDRVAADRVAADRVAADRPPVGRAGTVLQSSIPPMPAETSAAPAAIQLGKAVDKLLGLRIFPDTRGRLHHSALDFGAEILAVPQFTLYARTDKGRRPDFTEAAAPSVAAPLFTEFVSILKNRTTARVGTGRFGADMQVGLVNDGPLTLMLEF